MQCNSKCISSIADWEVHVGVNPGLMGMWMKGLLVC